MPQLFVDCTGPAALVLNESSNGSLKFRGKFQEANAINKNKRMYPFDVLSANVEKLEETIKARGLFGELDHPCITSNNFSVLTTKGWREFKEIRVGDYVWSRVDGRMVQSRVNAIVDQPYDGPAYEVRGRSINSTFTPGHRFLLSERQDGKTPDGQLYATVRDIHDNREKYTHNPIPKTARWAGSDAATVTLPAVDRKGYDKPLTVDAKKFAAFLGIYLAEGCLHGKNRVNVSQKNETGVALIGDMLAEMHPDLKWKRFKDGFFVTDGRLYDYLVPLGKCYDKYVPDEVKNLSAECLEELLHWFAIGDGRMLTCAGQPASNHKHDLLVEGQDARLSLGASSRLDVFSVSRRLVDDLHECLVKTGRSGSRSVITTEKDYAFAGSTIRASAKRPLYQLHMSRAKHIHLDPRSLRITQVHHTGRIYCLSTQYGNFYMEQEGKAFWTGNSDSIIHLTNASHLITKLWWEGNNLMGEAEILKTPNGQILRNIIESGGRVGISSRGVGNGETNREGVLVVSQGFKLLSFDCVADPSTYAAFQEVVAKPKNESFAPAPKPYCNPRVLTAYVHTLVQSLMADR